MAEKMSELSEARIHELANSRADEWGAEVRFRSDFSVELIDVMGNDRSVCRAAKVSFSADTEVDEMSDSGVAKLIGFLMEGKHGTPFEHNSLTFRIEAPIFVWREFHRHRIGFSYNEQSGRYTEMKPVFYVPDSLYRPVVQEGRVGNYEFGMSADGKLEQTAQLNIAAACQKAYVAYRYMLERGIAKEVARMVLPVSLYSACYVTCNMRSLMAFLELRKAPQAMYEIRSVAGTLGEIAAAAFPVCMAAFEANGRVAP